MCLTFAAARYRVHVIANKILPIPIFRSFQKFRKFGFGSRCSATRVLNELEVGSDTQMRGFGTVLNKFSSCEIGATALNDYRLKPVGLRTTESRHCG